MTPPLLTRRAVLLTGAAALIATIRAGAEDRAASAQRQLAELEARAGGRLGVAALDCAGGRAIEHRADQRFAMCSTFKLPLVACVLARVDAGQERLDRFIAYGPQDLLDYAPVARAHADDGGMTVAELCDAAVTQSDNTAANLLLETIEGPAGLTRYLRNIGDSVSRLDRREPELNDALPGDPRDTTTPAAMLGTIKSLLLGGQLSQVSRERLYRWLIASTTGSARLRAGLPADWRAGDKTGSGARGATNDVAILWPPQRDPILVAAYYAESAAPAAVRNAVLAQAGRIVAETFGAPSAQPHMR